MKGMKLSVNHIKSITSFKKALVIFIFVFFLMLALTSCIQIVSPTQAETATAPVLIVTQVITQIIPPTPIPETPAATKTFTPEPPTPSPTFDPISAPIYFPLEDCVASRLHVGDVAMVSLVGGPNGIRFGQDLSTDTIIAYAQPGSKLEIVNGPWCSRGWIRLARSNG